MTGLKPGLQDKAACANCGYPVNTGTFKHKDFTIYCGACGVESLRKLGADDATMRSAERAAQRTRARHEQSHDDEVTRT